MGGTRGGGVETRRRDIMSYGTSMPNVAVCLPSLLTARNIRTGKGREGALLYKESSGIIAKILVGVGWDGLKST